MRYTVSLHHDVDQFVGHNDHPHNLLAGDCSFDLLICQGKFADFFIWGADCNHNVAAVLTVDLDWDLNLILFGQLRIEFRPRLAQQDILMAERLPQLRSKIRSKWRDEQYEIPQRICYLLSRDYAVRELLVCSIQSIHQFHDGGN